MWAIRVRVVLDEAASLRAAAHVAGMYDPKAAAEALRKADMLVTHGAPTAGGGAALSSDAEAVADWEKMHGGSWADPAVREKVYTAVAAMRKMEREEADRAAAGKLKAAAGSAKLRRRKRG